MLDPLAILRRSFRRRRRGKIGNLPESVREQINLMLDHGLPYAEIIATLLQHLAKFADPNQHPESALKPPASPKSV